MFATIAAAVALLASAPQRQGTSLDAAIVVFQKACLQERGDRDALRSLASANGWKKRAESLAIFEWSDAYMAGGLVVRLSHKPMQDGVPSDLICSVDWVTYEDGWREKMAAVSVEGGLLGAPQTPSSSYRMPPGFQVGIWDLPDGSRIHATVTAPQPRIELSVNLAASDPE